VKFGHVAFEVVYDWTGKQDRHTDMLIVVFCTSTSTGDEVITLFLHGFIPTTSARQQQHPQMYERVT